VGGTVKAAGLGDGSRDAATAIAKLRLTLPHRLGEFKYQIAKCKIVEVIRKEADSAILIFAF